jgi:outer membrane receptor for ferrienterochelin and colicins
MKSFTMRVFALLIISALACTATAEEAQTFTIEVNDGFSPIPRALVKITGVSSSFKARKFTDSEGAATFENLPKEKLAIAISATGFEKFATTIDLASETTSTFEVKLVLPQFSDTVVITTANRREEVLKNVAEPVTVISRAEIESSGAASAKDLLVDQVGSGLQVQNGGGLGHVSINGVSQKGVLMLLNGRRVLGKNGNGEFSLDDIDISNVERIEIVKGAGSALYGSDAIAGVINLITVKPEGKGLSATSSISAGGNEDYRASSSLSYQTDATSAAVNTSYRSFGGYDLIEETRITEGQGENKYYQVGGELEHRFNDRITVRGLFNYNKRDLDDFYREDFMSGTGYFKTTQEITRLTASPEIEFALTDTTVINARYNFSDYYRDEIRDYGTHLDEQLPWQEWNHEGQVTLRHGYEFGDRLQTLQAGYEYRDENMDRENISQPGQEGTFATRNIQVFWAQNEFVLGDMLSVNLGFRYDDYSDFGNEFSPKVSAILGLTDQTRIRASYGHGFRAPNFGELYLDLGFFFKGNPELKPETSDNFTVGISHTGEYISGSVDYFYNDVVDGIVFDLSSFPYTYRNQDEMVVTGINADVSLRLPYGLVPSFAYSFTKREDGNGEDILNYPKHAATIRLAWLSPQYGLSVNLRGKINGEVEYDNGTSRPDYQIWHLNARKNLFTSTAYKVSLFGQVDNLFDESDFFLRDEKGNMSDRDMELWYPRRTFTIGINIDFDGM